MVTHLKRLWRAWLEIARYIGDFQSRLLLTIFYFTVLIPFGLLVRAFSDPLRLRSDSGSSAWIRRSNPSESLRQAQRQS